ncbi:MAG: DsbA family protein [Hyphomicrobiales bacterium]|nr:DsbA family protein [Hyphomicrobiales bacterium]
MSDLPPAAPDMEADVDVLAPGTIVAIVDPLCGWCWGAAPALARIAESPIVRLEILASGLFIGGRPMTPDFADYAWKNDCRIRDLTGQTFSEAYREQVLGNFDTTFDSGPATLAFAAVQLAEPDKAMRALHALQAARWVDGRDVTADAVCAEVLREIGCAEETVAAYLAEDETVIDLLNQRAALARELMTHVEARGVPTLLRIVEGGVEKIDGRLLFEDAANILVHVAPPAGAA